MSHEFCPGCRRVTAMRLSEERTKATDAEGRVRRVLTRTWHCEVCHVFVLSEEVEDTGRSAQAEP